MAVRTYKEGGLYVVRMRLRGRNYTVKDVDEARCIARAKQIKNQVSNPRPSYDDYYWMVVSNDEYELPLFVAESLQELADYCGVKQKSIIESLSRYENGRKWSRFRRVLKDGD